MSAAQFRAAKAGSISAIEYLVLLPAADESHFRKLFPILFHHLSLVPPPSGTCIGEHTSRGNSLYDLVLEPRFQLVSICLGALVEGLFFFSNEEAQKRVLTPNWPCLRDWIRFTLLIVVMESEDFLSVTAPGTKKVTCHTIAMLLVFTRDGIPGTDRLPGHGPLALRLWLYVKRFQVAVESFQKALPSFGIHYSTQPDLLAVFIDVPDASEILLGDLRRGFEGSIEEADFYIPLAMLHSIFTGPCPPSKSPTKLFRNRLASAGVIPELIETMFSITSPEYSSLTVLGGPANIYNIVLITLVSAMVHIGPWAFHQALRYDLVDALIDATSLFEPLKHDDIVSAHCKVLESLCSFWIQPYILREAKRRLDLDDLSGFIASLDPASKLHQSWTTFHDTFIFYRDLRRQYKLMGRPTCSNSKCSSGPILVTNLKRCQGCCSAHYCSRECQKIDWKLAHRNKCTPPPAVYSYRTVPKIEADFVTWCLSQRAYKALRAEPAVRDLFTSKRGPHPVVIVFDYTFAPSTMTSEITIISGQEALWSQQAAGFGEETQSPLLAKSTDRDRVIVCAVMADIYNMSPSASWCGQITDADIGLEVEISSLD
ncbi:hypothetical protein C8J56DRAFT_943447 [Mycena floridula]|nr:hypothetical protein C8J56DRAFT_943447 [Mycena floridula]